MVSEGVPQTDVSRPGAQEDLPGEADRLARHDLLVLRMEAARRQRRRPQGLPRPREPYLDRISD
ncbi:MAG TPA: hypothetical protein VFP72_04855 [Kineosporiaceae bacterium]|nr:hypothetical protein [Kineosporiaceae bacterium]